MAGGALDEIFFKYGRNIYVLRFNLPRIGRLWRSNDHGSTKPWAVLYWWESDGSDLVLSDGRTIATRVGDLFEIGEVYGFTGTPNQGKNESIASILTKIYSYELARGWIYQDALAGKRFRMFKRGFADSANGAKMNEISINDEFANTTVRVNGVSFLGIEWELVSKPAGSRVTSFALLRERLIGTAPREGARIRESKGLFIAEDDCPQSVRTMRVLRRDPLNLGEIDSEAEDHIADAVRYILMANRSPGFSTHRRQVW